MDRVALKNICSRFGVCQSGVSHASRRVRAWINRDKLIKRTNEKTRVKLNQ
ncbi:MAG: hypothetical protein J7M30_08405 [Deltaproteobacteria bacterium]|nr:hypothetical protein [Deltaproteobacteria bacterium]